MKTLTQTAFKNKGKFEYKEGPYLRPKKYFIEHRIQALRLYHDASRNTNIIQGNGHCNADWFMCHCCVGKRKQMSEINKQLSGRNITMHLRQIIDGKVVSSKSMEQKGYKDSHLVIINQDRGTVDR